MALVDPSTIQTVTKKPDGTTITDSGGHWNIKFPPRPDGSIKTYYENVTNVVKKDGKIVKQFTEYTSLSNIFSSHLTIFPF